MGRPGQSESVPGTDAMKVVLLSAALSCAVWFPMLLVAQSDRSLQLLAPEAQVRSLGPHHTEWGTAAGSYVQLETGLNYRDAQGQ